MSKLLVICGALLALSVLTSSAPTEVPTDATVVFDDVSHDIVATTGAVQNDEAEQTTQHVVVLQDNTEAPPPGPNEIPDDVPAATVINTTK